MKHSFWDYLGNHLFLCYLGFQSNILCNMLNFPCIFVINWISLTKTFCGFIMVITYKAKIDLVNWEKVCKGKEPWRFRHLSDSLYELGFTC